MATAKKPSTKKPAKKPAAKRASASSATTKKTVKKEVAAATVKPSARKQLTPLERLRSRSISMAIMGLIFAVATIFVVGPNSSELLLSVQSRDLFANTNSVVLGSASEVITNVQYRYLLSATLLIGAVAAVLLATKLRKPYEAGVAAAVSTWRWILLGVTSALLLETVSFIAGVQDLVTLKLVVALTLLAALFGWFSERDNAGSKDSKLAAYGGYIFAGVLAFVPAISSLIGTSIYGGERFGWHVYALLGALLASFIASVVILRASIKKKNQVEYTVFEQRYLLLDQLTKFLVVLIVFSALAK